MMACSSSVDDHALLLGLTLSTSHHHPPPPPPISHHVTARPNNNNLKEDEPSLSLSLLSSSAIVSADQSNQTTTTTATTTTTVTAQASSAAVIVKKDSCAAEDDQLCQGSPPLSAVSSFSVSGGNKVVVMKRERDLSISTTEEMEADQRRNSDLDDDVDAAGSARKKLRLTKDQSALLEDSFKHHSTLNPKQKQALARQLGLRARQVEVWFQNRRARTKLKQTEVDCEFLKKCCETLTDENRRLQKELQELKLLKSPQQQPAAPAAAPLYVHMPAATLTICPSCERMGGGGAAAVAAATATGDSPFSMATKPHFFNPFANPSAAC